MVSWQGAAVRMERARDTAPASRMQRRRSWMESKMGMRQDFDRKERSRSICGAELDFRRPRARVHSRAWNGSPSFAIRGS